MVVAERLLLKARIIAKWEALRAMGKYALQEIAGIRQEIRGVLQR